MNKGLSLKNIAIVQICYMVAIIIFEFPSGVISDIFDRKIVYLASIFLLMISYFIIFNASSFVFFVFRGLIQFFYQPSYLYWQAIFIDKNIAINIFGIIYVLFSLSNIIGVWIFRKIKHSKYDIYVILAIIFLLSVLIKIVSHIYIFITIIIFLVILISVYSNNLEFF
ncbi:MFS transporter [Borreliella lusitaniae]|uniref:MFS transporter n=1 Tax=Borreliella lusitaniae TaxID=100177 RepID=UPI003AB1A3D1